MCHYWVITSNLIRKMLEFFLRKMLEFINIKNFIT